MTKKNVGIMSMQRIYNYGSFLQAYALKHILMEIGYDVQFVDYHPGKCLVKTEQKNGIARKIKKGLETLNYKASLKDKLYFIQYKRQYAKNYYPLLGIDSEKMNYFPRLDALVIGSDEVFNCVQDNANVGYSRELFGYQNNADKLVSYAASFGNTTMEKINQYAIRNTLKKDLQKFDCISVRDNNSKQIIKEVLGITSKVHLDPVLIYDWQKHISKEKKAEKYMIVYGYSGRFSNSECDRIKDFAKNKGLKVICIGGIQNIPNSFMDCSPFEVLTYFQYAEYVITDTFHGTIMSIVMHRRFATFIRKSGYGNSEKLKDLLLRLQLTERIVDKQQDMEKILQEKIEYAFVDKLIEQSREESYAYLKGALG